MGTVTNAQVFARYTLKALDVGTIVHERGRRLYGTLDEFNQQCFNYDSRDVQYNGETFQRLAYDYLVYILYVYYYQNELLFLVVDGNVGGYAVVNEDVWNQNFL